MDNLATNINKVYIDKVLTHLNNPKYIIDIGSHIGQFSKSIYEYYGDCKFMLVDANENCKPYLEKLPFDYKIVALSNTERGDFLYLEKANKTATGASLKKENTIYYADGLCDTIPVYTNTLDNCCFFENNFVDLLKVDTQGSELDILRGGINTLMRSKLVLIEVSTIMYNQEAPLFDVVFNFMKNNGFEIIDITEFLKIGLNNNQHIAQMDVLFRNTLFPKL